MGVEVWSHRFGVIEQLHVLSIPSEGGEAAEDALHNNVLNLNTDKLERTDCNLFPNLRNSEATINLGLLPLGRKILPQASQPAQKAISWEAQLQSSRPFVPLGLQRILVWGELLRMLVHVIVAHMHHVVVDLLRIRCVFIYTKPDQSLI